MTYPFVQELAAEGFPVRLTCGVLGLSTQAFYKWQCNPISERDWDDAHLVNAIRDVHADDPEFGYRFVADELESAGHVASERRVWRLCSEHRIWSTTTKKGRRGAGKRPGPAVHDDLVRRNFTAPAPDRVWLTDLTEHPTSEGKLYICCIKDVYSRRIVGYATSDRMTASLAVSALRQAVARRQPKGIVVVHSDRGGQFRARSFVAVLKAAGLVGSMGRVASAGDNAAMESFHSLLRRTSSTAIAGRTGTTSPTRPSTGSSTPTTADVVSADSGSSPRSSSSSHLLPSLRAKQPDQSQPVPTKPTADPCPDFWGLLSTLQGWTWRQVTAISSSVSYPAPPTKACLDDDALNSSIGRRRERIGERCS